MASCVSAMMSDHGHNGSARATRSEQQHDNILTDGRYRNKPRPSALIEVCKSAGCVPTMHAGGKMQINRLNVTWTRIHP